MYIMRKSGVFNCLETSHNPSKKIAKTLFSMILSIFDIPDKKNITSRVIC